MRTNFTFSKLARTFTQCLMGYVNNQVCLYVVPKAAERRVEPILSKRFSSLQICQKRCWSFCREYCCAGKGALTRTPEICHFRFPGFSDLSRLSFSLFFKLWYLRSHITSFLFSLNLFAFISCLVNCHVLQIGFPVHFRIVFCLYFLFHGLDCVNWWGMYWKDRPQMLLRHTGHRTTLTVDLDLLKSSSLGSCHDSPEWHFKLARKTTHVRTPTNLKCDHSVLIEYESVPPITIGCVFGLLHSNSLG